MAVRLTAPLKYDKERVTYWIDLSSELLLGETLGSVVSVSAISTLGNDMSPDATLDGTQVVRTSVGVSVKDGTIGEMYEAEVIVSTSLGRSISGLVGYAVVLAPVVPTIPLPFPPTDPVYRETVLVTEIGQGKTLFLGRVYDTTTIENPEVAATLDWGDGTPVVTVNQAINFSVQNHTYAAPGTYQIKITGICRGIFSPGTGDVQTLGIDNFGTVGLRQIDYSTNFQLTYAPSYLPDTMEVLTNVFRDCRTFNSGAVSFWDVSRINRFSNAFSGCWEFNQPLAGWDVHSGGATRFDNMFSECHVFNQNISNWDVSLMEEGQYMFGGCRVFNQPLNTWDVSKNTDFSGMLQDCWEFNQPLDTWDVSSGTLMSAMFQTCLKFNQPLGMWDVSNITFMNYVFSECIVFNQDLSTWDTSACLTMGNMFSSAVQFNGNISTWNTANVQNMSFMFASGGIFIYQEPYGTMAFSGDLSSWDVGNVTDMSGMFRGCPNFNSDISSWVLSSLVNMPQMFQRATQFDQPIGSWNLPNVRSLDSVFSGRFDPGEVDPLLMAFSHDVSGWNISSTCTNMLETFAGCSSFNSDMSTWNTENVTTMFQMFSWCLSFNGSLATWNTSKVTATAGMFLNNVIFNQPLDHFDMSSVSDTRRMFVGCWAFDQDISGWDVSAVTTMTQMFFGSSIFNQDIGNWSTSLVTDMGMMFYDAFTFNQDLSGWCVSLIPTEPVDFDTGANAWTDPRPVWGTCPP